jgi:hypothetical protein
MSVQVVNGSAYPIRILTDDKSVREIESIEGVLNLYFPLVGPVFVTVAPHYDVEEVAAAIRKFLQCQ